MKTVLCQKGDTLPLNPQTVVANCNGQGLIYTEYRYAVCSQVHRTPAEVVSRTRIAGEGVPNIYPSPVISRTRGRRGTRGATIESSYQDNSNRYLKFSLKGHVQGQGQRSKAGFAIFRHRLRTVNSSGPQISVNAPKLK